MLHLLNIVLKKPRVADVITQTWFQHTGKWFCNGEMWMENKQQFSVTYFFSNTEKEKRTTNLRELKIELESIKPLKWLLFTPFLWNLTHTQNHILLKRKKKRLITIDVNVQFVTLSVRFCIASKIDANYHKPHDTNLFFKIQKLKKKLPGIFLCFD